MKPQGPHFRFNHRCRGILRSTMYRGLVHLIRHFGRFVSLEQKCFSRKRTGECTGYRDINTSRSAANPVRTLTLLVCLTSEAMTNPPHVIRSIFQDHRMVCTRRRRRNATNVGWGRSCHPKVNVTWMSQNRKKTCASTLTLTKMSLPRVPDISA